MASVSVTQALPVDPQKAWDALSDLAGWENWLSIHQNWKSELPAEVTEGTRVTEVVSVMGMANKIEWTITHVDAPHTVTTRAPGWPGSRSSSPCRWLPPKAARPRRSTPRSPAR
ncbi:type II toxin-antitoxin system Rv0910 family toxin [Amycolatopsis echigonensis]